MLPHGEDLDIVIQHFELIVEELLLPTKNIVHMESSAKNEDSGNE